MARNTPLLSFQSRTCKLGLSRAAAARQCGAFSTSSNLETYPGRTSSRRKASHPQIDECQHAVLLLQAHLEKPLPEILQPRHERVASP